MSNKKITKRITGWYYEHKRMLPWRDTKNPYLIWLSEIILQQTRVAQGLSYYEKFVISYPNVHDLANAELSEVLRLWQGLGYYSRARNLHFAAQQVVNEHEGKFPTSYLGLKKLKGVGDYTAAAIASFAFEEEVPVVDGNVYRVLARLFAIDIDIASSKAYKHFFEVAKQLICHEKASTFNQAIMEFGALQCTPKNPQCGSCPISIYCKAYQENKTSHYPIKIKKIKIKKRYFNYAVLNKNHNILMNERKDKDIWQGLYDFPLLESKDKLCTEDELITWLKENTLIDASDKLVLKKVSKVYKHILSHQHIYAIFYYIHIENPNSNRKLSDSYHSLQECFRLPKPILIANYLKESIF